MKLIADRDAAYLTEDTAGICRLTATDINEMPVTGSGAFEDDIFLD